MGRAELILGGASPSSGKGHSEMLKATLIPMVVNTPVTAKASMSDSSSTEHK